MRTQTFSIAGALAAIVFSSAAFAIDPPAAGASAPHGRMRQPSPAAIAACSGKAEGASVTWLGRKGQERTGKCVSHNGTLVARPDMRAHAPRAGASAPTK